MYRAILIAASLGLFTAGAAPALADMYQDASNAKLPEAQRNLSNLAVMQYTKTASAITLTQTPTSANKIDFGCLAQAGG